MLAVGGCGGASESRLPVEAPGAGGPSALSTPVWYVIADAGGGGGGNDRLFSVDITLPVPQNAQTAIGAGTGTNNIEGSAFWPGSDTLYAFNNDRLGTISLTTGVWTQSVTTDVWNDGNTANLVGLSASRAPESLAPNSFSDIDSVAFDPNTGVAYGVARIGGADALFIFDTGTGHIVRGAFSIGGSSYDYFRVPPVEPGNLDIDDIAIDPYDGQLYGIANGGGLADRLVRIDKATGVASDVGALGVNDMEGFAFYNDATMWGVTGSGSNTAADGSSNNNAVFSINRVTGEAFDRRSLTVGGSDFESMAFLTADLNEFCGRVWCDDNGNGIQDPGELGVSGVTVVLWRDLDDNDVLDADLDPALVSTVTDASGDYCFGVASTGDYVITLDTSTLPADFVLTQANVQPVSVTGFGNTVNGLDFVKTGAVATLGDTVFFDADSDGLQGPTEPGLRGIKVDLYDPGLDGLCGTADDVFQATTTTDGGGYYLFSGLSDGPYCVDVDESTLPPGATLTTANEPYAATITAGSNDLDGDFGYVYPGRIGDLVWLDVDADGVVDAGEPGLANVDLTLTQPGPDGYFGTADDVTAGTTTTAADGSYEFGNLPAGSYSVTVDVTDVPTGATLTTFTTELRLNLRQGQTLRDADFGFVGNASLGDRVWNDDNTDGIQDGGELGIPGVTLTLVEAGPDGTLGTADDVGFPPQVTDAGGLYTFPGLVSGSYRVSVDASTLPPGLTSLTSGNEPLDVALPTGTNDTTVDFGYAADDASIGDRVWNDANGNGVDDAGDSGLGGVQLQLTEAGPDDVLGTADDVSLFTTTTTASGAYDFPGLASGLYRVDVLESTLPAGASLTTGNEPADVVLGPRQDYDDADFGYVIGGSLGDRVWLDTNGDGVQDGGEPGLNGVTVVLTEAGPDGAFGTADDVPGGSQVTAGDGDYAFTGLSAGLYRVDVSDGTLPAGLVSSTANDPLDRSLALGETFADADFGFWAPASIGDRVWDDVDGDGTQDPGEPGLSGVDLTLTGAGADGTLGTADDIALGSTTTGAGGAYLFADLAAGLYRVDVNDASLPAGYAGTTPDPRDVTIAAGEDVTTFDFGYWLAGSLGDRVWEDLDADGIQDPGEPGINGATVNLTEAGSDGVLGTADDVSVGAQVTAGDGDYGFTGLPPGLYRIDVSDGTVPAGMAATTTDPLDVTVNAGDVFTTVDFGFRHSGRIGDRVWDDLDGDGVQDPGEPGLDGITVLVGTRGPDGVCGTADDGPQTAATTSGGGLYAVEGLPPADYCVIVDGASLPAGYVPTTGGGLLGVPLSPGQVVTTADFGFRRVGAIGDRVWRDVDRDGVQDPGEPGLTGVTVVLLEAGPDGAFGTADDVTFPDAVTGADGAYLFAGLPAGLYRVDVDVSTAPAGMILTTSNDPLDVPLAAGGGSALADFGFQYAGAIGDRIWNDLDGDGVQDVGEPGLNGVTVRLREAGPDGTLGTADDVLLPDAVTSGDGDYGYTNLPPGLYRVDVDPSTLPLGMERTSAALPLDVTLGTGEQRNDLDVGYRFAGSIGDRIWQDVDFDGTQDPGEPGLAGVTVLLTEAGPDTVLGTADDVAVGSRTTGAGGDYLFEGLPAGSYRMLVDVGTLPAGLVLTSANQPLDVTLAPSEDRLDVDVGYQFTGSIGDRVWNDTDEDGVQDAGEPGIGGVTIDVIEAGPDGVFGTADDDPQGSVTTAADGSYDVTGLPPGLYRLDVRESTLPPDLTLTGGSEPRDVALAGGQDVDDADFGYALVLYTVGDVIWLDSDRDGVYEPALGERPIPGVLVVMRDGSGAVVGTDTTNAAGEYRFFVPAGDYRVEIDPSNFQTGGPLVGLTSTGAGTNASATITADNFDLDFGFLGAAGGARNVCGWWGTNTSAWPLTSILLGGTTYTQAEARAILDHGNLIQASRYGRSAARTAVQVDMSMLVAWSLIGAKLNVGAGHDPSSIAATMTAADAWLQRVGFDSGIRAGHPSYAEGQGYCRALTAWNEGR